MYLSHQLLGGNITHDLFFNFMTSSYEIIPRLNYPTANQFHNKNNNMIFFFLSHKPATTKRSDSYVYGKLRNFVKDQKTLPDLYPSFTEEEMEVKDILRQDSCV